MSISCLLCAVFFVTVNKKNEALETRQSEARGVFEGLPGVHLNEVLGSLRWRGSQVQKANLPAAGLVTT